VKLNGTILFRKQAIMRPEPKTNQNQSIFINGIDNEHITVISQRLTSERVT